MEHRYLGRVLLSAMIGTLAVCFLLQYKEQCNIHSILTMQSEKENVRDDEKENNENDSIDNIMASGTNDNKEKTNDNNKSNEAYKNVQESGDDLKELPAMEPVRVLIRGDHYNGIYNDHVTISSEGDFYIRYGDKEKKYKGGEKVDIDINDSFYDHDIDVIFAKSEDDNGKIMLTSLKREYDNPAYRGTIEIHKKKKGLYVVNELSIEEYLYSVLPSEMPSSYEKEALKAQAICARAFACHAIEDGKYKKYHADLDDSTSSQVYNNIGETKEAIEAVNATRGVVPVSKDKIINAYFYSTSCGSGCDNKEAFGGTKEPYLDCELESIDLTMPCFAPVDTMDAMRKDESMNADDLHKDRLIDLSSEKDFKAFIREEKNGDKEQLEEDCDLYRWNVSISYDELTESIKRMNLDHPIGKVNEVKVTKRGESGIVLAITIKGSKGTLEQLGEYSIRSVLSPKNSTIHTAGGDKLKHFTMLPSAFFYIEETNDGVKLFGGGFGHGVGLSQNGANCLAKKGMKAEDIIKYYYKNIDLYRIKDKELD